MSPPLDNALRDALAQLADVPPPPGLAAAAIRIVRRRRKFQIAGATGVAAILLAAPVAVSAVGGTADAPADGPTGTADAPADGPTGTPTVTPTGTPAATPTVAQGVEPLVITAYSSGERWFMLGRDAGEYVELPYGSVTPSPDGTQALVSTIDGSPDAPDDPIRLGILDIASQQVRWIEGYTGTGNVSTGGWSRDGRQVLITERPVGGDKGFAIVDAGTLEVSFVPQADIHVGEVNNLGLRYLWAPDGQEVALTESTGVGDEAQAAVVSGIRFYNLAGNLTRVVPVSAALTSEAGFSPDGSRMALQDPSPAEGPVRIVDAVTGQLYHTLPAPGTFVGWADAEHLLVTRAGALRVVDLAGEVIREIQLRSGAGELHIGSSAGLTPDAAGLTFGPR
jgi:hypothetical protein